jgi:hypothetical protein
LSGEAFPIFYISKGAEDVSGELADLLLDKS